MAFHVLYKLNVCNHCHPIRRVVYIIYARSSLALHVACYFSSITMFYVLFEWALDLLF